MGGGALDFVEHAVQMEEDDCAEFFGCGSRSRAASFLEIGDQAIEGVVLAEEEDFVFASEIVVEVGGGEVSGGGDFAHAGFGEAAGADFAPAASPNPACAKSPPPLTSPPPTSTTISEAKTKSSSSARTTPSIA